ncbi:MAG: tRNA (adenosine(37)-N6)-threonylcarbamoyltransferase complex ATPase subunit type 1 TsaE [Acidimicrobiia bacterium]
MNHLQITTASPDETLALGRRFAACLTAGDVVLLSGRLGAGKTMFVQGVAEGLGIVERVTSPTFVITRFYSGGFLDLIHADVYRLSSVGEFDDLDLQDDGAEGVVFIEWGDSVEEAVGPDYLIIHVDIDGEDRKFSFIPSGTWEQRTLDMLS